MVCVVPRLLHVHRSFRRTPRRKGGPHVPDLEVGLTLDLRDLLVQHVWQTNGQPDHWNSLGRGRGIISHRLTVGQSRGTGSRVAPGFRDRPYVRSSSGGVNMTVGIIIVDVVLIVANIL